MKKLLGLLFALTLTLTGFTQVASRILSTQSTPQPISATNFVWVDNTPGQMNRLFVANADSLKIQWYQMKWWDDSVTALTTPMYKPLSWFPTWSEVKSKPTFSLVASTGQYNDLLGRPTLFSGSYLDLTNVPSVFPSNISNVSGLSLALSNKIDVGASIPYATLTGTPTLATVATSGLYSDLLGKPTLFSGTYADLTGKPTLFSGAYADLTGKPTLFPTDIANVSGLTTALNNKISVGASIPYSTLTGSPILATVATTGVYSDLTGLPTIPAAQVNSDWNSVSGVSQILNKPTIPTNTNQLTNGANFITASGAPVQSVNGQTGTVVLSIPAAQVQSDYTQSNTSALDYIKNKPTLGTAASTNSSDYATAAQGTLASTAVQPGTLTSTLANYVTSASLSSTLGSYVTSSALTSALGGYATTSALTSGLAGKENTIGAGTTAQYWRGDKTWQTLNTTVVPEGTNLYYTDARFDTRFATKTTTNLTEGTNLYYTDTRARASNSAGTGINYNSTTGVITNSAPDQTVTLTAGTGISVTGTYPNFTVGSTVSTPTINSGVVRTLNSNYTISSTQMATVYYTVNLSVTNPLLLGTSTATAFLEYSTNGGSTWTTANQVNNSSGVALTVSVAITTGNNIVLTGVIPANALTRIRTTTSGTSSVTYVTGQEVLN